VKEFADKVAIVTGGTRGIGRAIVLELARRGCHVAFNFQRSTELAEKLKHEVEELGVKALSFQVDATDFNRVKDLVKSVRDQLGKIDFLVNNAGVTKDKLLARMGYEDWQDVINTNLTGVFNFCKAVMAPMMRAKSGSILNITSVSGIVGLPGQVNYSASKAGVIGLTKALAKEVGRVGITVNALALGFVDTDMTANLDAEYKEKLLEKIPLQRFGTVEDIAPVAVFFLSPAACYITGAVIPVDGGVGM
jgi:3-oxoacyl-[acyl-carrier protein] reductase